MGRYYAPMIFDPARHEPLSGIPWDETRAREVIRAIVDDAQASIDDDCTWPWHPLDAAGAEPRHKSLYLGAAGVLWALWYLEREGAVALRFAPAKLIEGVHRKYLEEPDTGSVVPSYFLGEVGILLVQWRMTQSSAAAERLQAAIRDNIPNPANEALWAAPGTMVGALHMLEWTGDAAWKALFLDNVEHLWRLWQPSAHADGFLWTQDLYGEIVQLLGAGHGFAGNAYPLLRGAALLSEARREALYERCAQVVRATASVEGDCANWPPSVGTPRVGREKMLVQWCHGAPGMVTGLGAFPRGLSSDVDELLVMAGNMTWKAGPLAKGPGICHGTAGNGYAFLKLHERTGDAVRLERARAFGMHAIAQCERMREQHGQGRHSLWTGDPGLGIFLWHCVTAQSRLPSLDIL
jgi:hypothetical protein